MAKITIRYHIEDGYAGGSRPQSFDVESSDFGDLDDLDDTQISDQIVEMANEDMRQRFGVSINNLDEAIAEVKDAIAKDAE